VRSPTVSRLFASGTLSRVTGRRGPIANRAGGGVGLRERAEEETGVEVPRWADSSEKPARVAWCLGLTSPARRERVPRRRGVPTRDQSEGGPGGEIQRQWTRPRCPCCRATVKNAGESGDHAPRATEATVRSRGRLPAPKPRSTPARRGAPSRDRAETGAGGKTPRYAPV
jgi:hypothetical protein